MHKPKVLLVATYPIVEPRHGGQLRTRHIHDEYIKAGIEVDYCGIFPEGIYPDHSERDVQFPGDLDGRELQDYERAVYDHIWGLHVADMPAARDCIVHRLKEGRYDFVQIDLLYAWPLLRRCIDELPPDARRPRLIYSSQNIEHQMKRQVLSLLGAPDAVVDQYQQEVRDIEVDLIERADLLFAVSAEDRDEINAAGKRLDCVLARNGSMPLQVAEEATEPWREVLPGEPFAVFISSAHLPNAVGFFSLFGGSLAFLPPGRRLVIAGGVTGVIEANPTYRQWAAINDARSTRLGTVDDVGVAAVRRFGHVFVLPITAGGGSNIKTAEALLTGAYVLGTSTAFRGYEQYMEAPGVFVEDDPRAFRDRLLQLLSMDRAAPAPETLTARRQLLWDASLAPMPAKILDAFARSSS